MKITFDCNSGILTPNANNISEAKNVEKDAIHSLMFMLEVSNGIYYGEGCQVNVTTEYTDPVQNEYLQTSTITFVNGQIRIENDVTPLLVRF